MSSHSVILTFLLIFALKYCFAGSYFNLEEKIPYPTPVRNSPLLPRLLESLSVQKNGPDTSHVIKVEYDYIVVGAGAAGSVVAARLSEKPCVSVLLLEAGPPPNKLTDVVSIEKSFEYTNLDWHLKSTSQRHTGRGLINRKLKLPMGKGLGGSTVRNAGFYVRGNRKDFDGWAMNGAKGWSYEEVLPYFKKFEDNRDFNYIINGYHGVDGPITVETPKYVSEIKQPIYDAIKAMGYQIVDPNARRQTGFYSMQSFLRLGQKCSTAKGYLIPAGNRTNLDILPNAFVRQVIIIDYHAVGVLFDYNGLTYEVQARREVILSAGALKTPQILMLSGIGPEEHLRQFNIPVHANLPVGMNFQDHVAMSIEAALKPHIQEWLDKLGDKDYIKEYILHRSGPLTSSLGIMYVAFLHNDEIYPETDFPNYELYIGESPAKSALLDWNLLPEVFHAYYGPYLNGSTMSCFSQLLHTKSRGRIQLRSADPYDPPIIDPNNLADPRDVDDIVAGLKTCKKIIDRPEMKKVILEPYQTRYPGCEEFWDDDDVYFRCILRSVLYQFNHYCCTAKMGDVNDPTTVLDSQLRVKSIKGLRVVDASAMPDITSGNTGAPTIMIGEKAADMIKETIHCEYYCQKDDPFHYHPQNLKVKHLVKIN